MAPFWATYANFGQIFISTSGHTVRGYMGVKQQGICDVTIVNGKLEGNS